jgi:hypothetical protein
MADAFDQVPAQGAKPAGDAFDQIQPDKPLSWMDQAVDYAKGAWDNLKKTGQGMVDLATTNPATTLKNIGQAQDALRVKAEAAFKSGDYVSGTRHVMDYLLPVIGPGIDALGDEAASGQPGALAHSLGGATSLGLQLAGPSALNANAGAVANAADTTATAAKGAVKGAVKGATKMGQKYGVPIPAVAVGALAGKFMLDPLGIPPGASEAIGAAAPIVYGAWQGLKGALAERAARASASAEGAPEGAVATAPVSTPLPPQPEEGTPSGALPGEPPEVTAMRARLNGNGSAPTAPPPAPSTQNPAPYVAPDVPGALPGEPPAVTAMRQRLNGNGNGSAAPAPPAEDMELLDAIAQQYGRAKSFAKLAPADQAAARAFAARVNGANTEPAASAPAPAAPAPSPAPSPQNPAPATVYPNVGKTQPGYEDTLGPGLNVFRVPIGDVISTENPYGLGKGAKVAEYGARIQNGETPPPLYGRYDPTKGGVVLGDGNTRLEALRKTGAQTVDVATSNPKGFEAPAPAAPAPAAPPTQPATQSTPAGMIRLYHGTGASFENFDDALAGQNGGYYGKGHYLSDNPAVASGFAERAGEGGNVRAVDIPQTSKFFDPTAPSVADASSWAQHQIDDLGYLTKTQQSRVLATAKANPAAAFQDVLNTDRFKEWAQSQGYDGTSFHATDRATGQPQQQYVVFSGKNIQPAGAPSTQNPAPAAPPTQEEMAAPFKIDQAAYEAAQQARQAAGDAKHSGAADAWATEMANRLFANKVTPQDYQLLAPKYDPKGIDSSLDIVARNNGKSMITPASKMSADTLLKTRFKLQTLWNNSRPAAAPPFGQSGILTPQ